MTFDMYSLGTLGVNIKVKVLSCSGRASIDGVGQEGDQLAPGALNLKSIDI